MQIGFAFVCTPKNVRGPAWRLCVVAFAPSRLGCSAQRFGSWARSGQRFGSSVARRLAGWRLGGSRVSRRRRRRVHGCVGGPAARIGGWSVRGGRSRWPSEMPYAAPWRHPTAFMVPHPRAKIPSSGARSLPRLRARGVAVVMVMAVAVGRLITLDYVLRKGATPHVTRVTRDARHAFACARHHRASRASSPTPCPMPTMRARGVRSLAHLLLRTSPRRTPHCARDLGALVSATPPCMTPHPLCNTHGIHATHNTTRR